MNFKLQLGSNISLFIKIGSILVNLLLPMRNKFFNSPSIKKKSILQAGKMDQQVEAFGVSQAGDLSSVPRSYTIGKLRTDCCSCVLTSSHTVDCLHTTPDK